MDERKMTEQELFWMGDFGDAYTIRNEGRELISSNIALFSNILMRTGKIRNCIEIGANRGMNLMAWG